MTQDDTARIGAPSGSTDRRTATPTKRRKHIYPPEAQMMAEQAAAAARAASAMSGAMSGATTTPTSTPLTTPASSSAPAAAPKRRKHIYPPAAHVAAAPTNAGAVTASGSAPVNGASAFAASAPTDRSPAPKRRKHIYPPADQMAAERAAAAARVAGSTARNGAPTPVMAPPSSPTDGWAAESPTVAAVDADTVIDDDDGDALAADRVDVRRAAVGRVDAGEVMVSIGAVGAARPDSVSVDRGALGAAMATDVQVSRGYARSILARQVQIDRGAARMIVAADVRVERTAVLILLARRVSGDVRVLLDWRGALAFGAVAGVIGGLIARSRRR
jgi:hypothetical protein